MKPIIGTTAGLDWNVQRGERKGTLLVGVVGEDRLKMYRRPPCGIDSAMDKPYCGKGGMMKIQYIAWDDYHYRVTRTFDGIVMVEAPATFQWLLSGEPYRVWRHVEPHVASRVMERIAAEALGMTQEKRIVVLDGDPLAA